MGVIFRVSAIPGSDLPGRFSSLGHLGVYAVLGALTFVALQPNRRADEAVILAVFLAALYGITDEYHQSFVPMRTPDVADWGVDTLGAFVGALAAMSLARVVRARKG